MEYACITSMSKSYYDKIGYKMIETWKKYWNIESVLYVYSEDDLSFINTDRVNFVNWNIRCLSPWQEFSKTANNESEIKFAKKGYSCIDSWKTIKTDLIVWIDADIIFLNSIDQSVIDALIPQDKLIALFNHQYLGDRYNGWSSESGFFILNQNHNHYTNFVEEYEQIYNSPEYPSSIVGRVDNKILMLVASRYINDVIDLSDLRTKNKTTTPLNHSTLSPYMTHYKGRVKYEEEFKL